MGLIEWIIVIAIGLWLLGLVFRIGSKLIHILLVVGLLLLVLRLLGINL